MSYLAAMLFLGSVTTCATFASQGNGHISLLFINSGHG
jgi:hypothetical protein